MEKHTWIKPVKASKGAGDSDVVSALLKAFSNANTHLWVRCAAATALGQLGASNPDVVSALLKALSNTDNDSEVQQAVAWALGQLQRFAEGSFDREEGVS